MHRFLECRLIKRSDSVVPATDGTPDKENIRAAGGGQTGREKGPRSQLGQIVVRAPRAGPGAPDWGVVVEPRTEAQARRAQRPARGSPPERTPAPADEMALRGPTELGAGRRGQRRARAPSNFPPRPPRLESSLLPARGYRR